MSDIRAKYLTDKDGIEQVQFKTMSLRLKPLSHARVASYAKGCGLLRRDWLVAAINAGLKADPNLAGGEPVSARLWREKHGE